MRARACRRWAVAVLLLATCVAQAAPGDAAIRWQGHLDARLVDAGDARAWEAGGLGKGRYGAGDDGAVLAAGVLSAAWDPVPEARVSVTLQAAPSRSPALDVLDAWVRVRPVSTTRWRWSLRAGAFWAPVSMENDGVGWSSLWTLTPSAINSWVGEELRTIGAEGALEHRGDVADTTVFAAVFGWNDPAGELLAARGWALHDAYSGLGAVLREPDAYAPRARAPVPMEYRPFRELDGRPGWYAGVTRDAAGARTTLLAYDNRARPDAWEPYRGHRAFAWDTRFVSLGTRRPLGTMVLAAQAMAGSTAFEPQPGPLLDTRFHAGYLLLARDTGTWRPAVRLDLFGTRQQGPTDAPLDEHGHAMTFALNWRPRPHVRLVAEVLRVDSTRAQRRLEGAAPRAVEVQVQLAARLYF